MSFPCQLYKLILSWYKLLCYFYINYHLLPSIPYQRRSHVTHWAYDRQINLTVFQYRIFKPVLVFPTNFPLCLIRNDMFQRRQQNGGLTVMTLEASSTGYRLIILRVHSVIYTKCQKRETEILHSRLIVSISESYSAEQVFHIMCFQMKGHYIFLKT